MNRSRKRIGFTLIELLIVIAIIAILAAILFPVFARARENARRASCQSNMKQVALGVAQYVSDNDGRLMPFRNYNPLMSGGPGVTEFYSYFDPVQPYLKSPQLLFCPSYNKFKPSSVNAAARQSSAYQNTHYGFPALPTAQIRSIAPITDDTPNDANWDVPISIVMDIIPEPSRSCMLGETHGSAASQIADGWGNPFFYALTFTSLAKARHLEGANYAYLDGHVKWLPSTAVDGVKTAQGSNGQGITAGNASPYPIVFAWYYAGWQK